jgi:integrase
MRLGELLGLQESDLDLDAGCLTIRQTLKEPGRNAQFERPKTERSKRTITLPPSVVDTLRQLRRWKMEQKLKRGPRFL